MSQLAPVDVSVEEDKCIMLLSSLPYSWEKFILSILSNLEYSKMDTLVGTFLAQAMRKKTMDSSGESLNVRGRPKERGSK